MKVGDGAYPWVQLRYVAKPGTGHTPSRARPELWMPAECAIPWFTLADVWQIRDSDVTVVENTAEHVSAAGIAASSAVLHPAETVLLSRTASVGFSAVMGVDMAVSQDYMTWTPGPRIEPRFLLYVLRGLRPELDRLMTGSTHKTVYMPDLLALRGPVPPVAEQHLIADFLDRECDRVSELAREISEYQSTISSRWLSAFERSLSRERHTRRLKHFEADLQLGPFGSLLGADEYVSHGVPVINPMHIHWLGLRPEDGVTVAEERATSLRRYRLLAGDVVLARRGELGRACVVSGSENGYICGTGSARVRVDPSRLAPEFLVFALMTEPARAHMMLTAVGSTMPNLNAPALLDLRLPDWPVGEQLAAVSAAMASWESSAVLMREVRGTYEALMEYRDALITEAVTGELDVSRLSDRQLDESARAALEGETPEVLAR